MAKSTKFTRPNRSLAKRGVGEIGSAPRRWYELRPTLRLLLIALVAALVFGAGPLLSMFVRRQVVISLQNRAPHAAVAWLDWHDRWRSPTASTLFHRARADRKLGRLDDVARILKHAMERGLPRSQAEREARLVQVQAGGPELEESVWTDLISTAGDEAREVYEAFAIRSVLNYDVEAADRFLDGWLADFPQDPLPELLRGRIAEHGQLTDEAESRYRTAIAKLPSFAPAYYHMGRLSLGRRQMEAAINWHRQAEARATYPEAIWIGIAHAHRILGELTEAEALLNRVADAPRERLEQAFRDMGDPADSAVSAVFAERGQLRLAQRKYEEAIDDFQTALNANPLNHVLKLQLATAMRGAGRSDDAAEMVRDADVARAETTRLTPLLGAVRANPSDPAPRVEIGRIFLRHFSPSQGVVWLNSALGLDPNLPEAHDALAEHFAGLALAQPERKRQAEYHRGQAVQARRRLEARRTSETAPRGDPMIIPPSPQPSSSPQE